MGMTHTCVSERQVKRSFDCSVLVQRQISKVSTIKSGSKLMPYTTSGGLQPVRIAFR